MAKALTAEVPVIVRHAGGAERLTVDQTQAPEPSGAFARLGTFRFDDKAAVEIRNEGTSGHVIIDAVQFLPAGP